MTIKPGQKSAFYGEKGMRLVRSWKILLLLAEAPEPLLTAEIHRRIHLDADFYNNECGLQTIREDLKTLIKAGFPVQMITADGTTLSPDSEDMGRGVNKNLRWRFCEPTTIGHFTSPKHQMPTASDVLNLSLCRSLLAMDVPSSYPLFPVMEKLLEELHCRMNQTLRRGEPQIQNLQQRILHLGKRFLGSETTCSNWAALAQAIGKKQVLNGNYRNSHEQTPKPVDIAPFALWIDEGRSYVLGAGGTDHQMRSWRVDRFSDLTVAIDKKPPQITEDAIQQKLRSSFRGYISDPVEICLQVQPEISYLFHEYLYHPTQKITEQNNGTLLVTLNCPLNWSLEEWILGFGEHVRVLEPEELKVKLKKRIGEMSAWYD